MFTQRKGRKTSSTLDQQALLRTIANIHQDAFDTLSGTKWRGQFGLILDWQVSNLQDDLRTLWCPDTPIVLKEATLKDWLREEISFNVFRGKKYFPFTPSLHRGEILPDPRNLTLTLAFAVLRFHRRMKMCANKECPAPYFIAKRKDQKYCERGDCTAEAHRAHARKYWNSKGAQLRRERNRQRRKRPRNSPARPRAPASTV